MSGPVHCQLELNLSRKSRRFPGGIVGRVGVPQDETGACLADSVCKNVTVSGGPAPVRANIEELLPDILDGRIEPGRVFAVLSASTRCPMAIRR